jgi:competence protein ComEC
MDVRGLLAADRVFAEIRVPRAVGTIVLERGAGGESWLARGRAFLQGKLLEHTTREDVEAGYAMEALLLGVREPVIDEVTRAFSEAGVAHLLAISGAHVVFVAGVVWGLLRMVPMRPRWREVLVAAAVLAYVLATPCGPPVVRAAVAVVMVVIARLLGRPAVTLNMLAAAAIVVLLWRPTDVLDAGFQLSFVGTAGLIVFAERVYGAVFGAWIEREKTIAGLAGTWWAGMQVRVIRVLCALLVANGIGVATTMPLVALHFRQVNPLGVFTGMVALPAVAVAMVASAAQVAIEVMSSTAGAWAAPVTALAGRMMVWVVEHLAMIPGSALSVRSPAWGVVAGVYGVWIVWAGRRRIGVSRAGVVNLAVASLAAVAGWYAVTMPRGELRVEVLRVGIGSAMVVRMPDGAVWVVDAGSREVLAPMERAVMPALRVEGVRRIAGMVVMGLDEVHARDAGAVTRAYRPGAVVAPAAAWRAGEFTRAGAAVEEVVEKPTLLAAGDGVEAGGVKVTWAAEGMMVWEFAGRRVVMVDGKAVGSLSRWVEGQEGCDAVIVTGAEARGMGELLGSVDAPVVRAGNVVRVGAGGLRIERF